jgi:hypothetical protein
MILLHIGPLVYERKTALFSHMCFSLHFPLPETWLGAARSACRQGPTWPGGGCVVRCVKVGPRVAQHSEAGRWQGLDWGSMAHPIANGGDIVSHIQTRPQVGPSGWLVKGGGAERLYVLTRSASSLKRTRESLWLPQKLWL